MESHCLRHTEIPHTSRLFSDFLYQFDHVAAFYDFPPNDASSYKIAATQIRFPPERRQSLVAALREQNGNSEALDLLSRPETAAVVTGQQVGLFSGPAYTIYKALTAAKLARSLTEQGIPSVPVFWLATEDHDFAEINHCCTFDAAYRPVRLEEQSSEAAQRPVGEIAVAESPSEELRRALQSFPFGEEVAELAAHAYAPGATLGTAFRELLKKLLSAYGLLYADPMAPAVRELAAPLLRQAVETGPELVRLLLNRNRILEDAGYHAQVHVEQESSLVFLLDGGRRLALRRQSGDYLGNERRFPAQELAGRANQLSPNALLRPVVQDYLLPTVAYVCGPAELAYVAQAQVLYRALLGRMPVALHRGSFTLLDSRSERLFQRYGLTLPDFFHGEEALRERIATKLVPADQERRFAEATSGTKERLDDLHSQLTSFDPTLAAALDKSRKKILYQFSKMERKVARESLRRNERATEEAGYLYRLLYPHKHLQERFYSILPFVARHGFDLIGRIYENVQLDCPDHQLLVV
jgi:bacillithiol biosynthesis cysteine-adding enzyme BshC